MTDTKALTAQIKTLAAEVESNAITPEYLAGVLRTAAALIAEAATEVQLNAAKADLEMQLAAAKNEATTKFNNALRFCSMTELDTLFAEPLEFFTNLDKSRLTLYVTDPNHPECICGRCEMFADNMHHQLTQVLTTHYLLGEGSPGTGSHDDMHVFTYFRSYGLAFQNAGESKPPYHAWSAWKNVDYETFRRLAALEQKAVVPQATTEGQAKEFVTSSGQSNPYFKEAGTCVLTVKDTLFRQDSAKGLVLQLGFYNPEDKSGCWWDRVVPSATTAQNGVMTAADKAALNRVAAYPAPPVLQQTVGGTSGKYIFSSGESNSDRTASATCVLTVKDTNIHQADGQLKFQLGLYNPANAGGQWTTRRIQPATLDCDGAMSKEDRTTLHGMMINALGEGTATLESVPVRMPFYSRQFTLSKATTARAGLMTASDKGRLDDLAAHAPLLINENFFQLDAAEAANPLIVGSLVGGYEGFMRMVLAIGAGRPVYTTQISRAGQPGYYPLTAYFRLQDGHALVVGDYLRFAFLNPDTLRIGALMLRLADMEGSAMTFVVSRE